MGWLSDQNDKADTLIREVAELLVPAGETLLGAAYANQQSTFSVKLFVLGVTEQHLIIQRVDRKWKPEGAVVIATPGEVEVGNIFSEGAQWTLGDKDMQLRFTARGEKYKLNILGGNLLENVLSSEGQAVGLNALADFLRRAKQSWSGLAKSG